MRQELNVLQSTAALVLERKSNGCSPSETSIFMSRAAHDAAIMELACDYGKWVDAIRDIAGFPVIIDDGLGGVTTYVVDHRLAHFNGMLSEHIHASRPSGSASAPILPVSGGILKYWS